MFNKKYALICVDIFILYLCIHYWENVSGLFLLVFQASTPLVIGFSIAYVLNILMSFYESHYFTKSTSRFVLSSKRPVCMLGAMATLVCLIAVLMRFVVPELVSCIKMLVSNVPALLQTAADKLISSNLITEDSYKQAIKEINWQENLQKITTSVISGIGKTAGSVMSIVSSVVSNVVNCVVGIVFAIYILLGKERLLSQFKRLGKRYIPAKWFQKLSALMTILNDCFHRYIVGQCTEAVILGILCIAGMLICRFPYAVMIGVLVGFTALIPVAGAYIGGAVGFLLIFTTSPVQACFFVLFLIVLQQLEGNLIYPKVVGSSLGLPALWVLAAVTIGGGLFGIAGMLLGVPLASAAYQIIKNDVDKTK